MDEPYRSEVECLRAENERLKRELSTRRSGRPVLAVVLALLDLTLVVALRPWLNGPSDGAFWGAFGVVALVAAIAFAFAVGRRRAAF